MKSKKLHIVECDFEADEEMIVASLKATLEGNTLDEIFFILQQELASNPDYTVGRGGRHIWVHEARADDDGNLVTTDNRVILIC